MDSTNPLRRHPLTVALHGTVALAILSLAAVGLYMVANEAWPLYDLHKSLGLILFAVILVRVALKHHLVDRDRTLARMLGRPARATRGDERNG